MSTPGFMSLVTQESVMLEQMLVCVSITPFGLTGGAGGVDDGGELAGQDLRGAHAIGGDFGAAGRGNQRFVAKTLGGKIGPPSATMMCSSSGSWRGSFRSLCSWGSRRRRSPWRPSD